jgi:glycerol-3-phosphate acyltransferase PlsY
VLFAGISIAAFIAYLVGSLPTGYLVARARGIDIRAAGSGNIGATNVFRVLGKPAGVLVLLVDLCKGALPPWLLPPLLRGWLGETLPLEPLALAAGVSAILGHNYTCWLRFKGGKGIATTAGVFLALMPKAFGLIVLVWGLTFALTRYVSVASLVSAVGLPVVIWLTGGSPLMIGVAAALGALAIYKHRSNIQRLLAGTEHRFSRKPPLPDSTSS